MVFLHEFVNNLENLVLFALVDLYLLVDVVDTHIDIKQYFLLGLEALYYRLLHYAAALLLFSWQLATLFVLSLLVPQLASFRHSLQCLIHILYLHIRFDVWFLDRDRMLIVWGFGSHGLFATVALLLEGIISIEGRNLVELCLLHTSVLIKLLTFIHADCCLVHIFVWVFVSIRLECALWIFLLHLVFSLLLLLEVLA